MDDSFDLRNRSILSQSYMQRVQQLSGNPNSSEDGFEISKEKLDARKKSWSWLFEKFSKIPDVGELNILTLEPDTESNGSHTSEIRIPVRKTAAQLQYWINTGNAPCQAMTMEASDTDETVSISESERADSGESESLRSTSMIVNKKLASSTEQLIATGSSASSVDTATYIKQNGKTGSKKEKDGLKNLDNNIVGRSMNAAIPRVLLSRLPENTEKSKYKKSSILCEGGSANVDKVEKRLSEIVTGDEIVSENKVGDKIDKVLEKRLKTGEVKDSEVTFDSKESDVGSLGVENLRKGEKREETKSSSASEEFIFAPNRTLSHGKRKLFTQNDTFFDIISPMVKSVHRISSIRKSFHPAFDSPSISNKIKPKNRPRLLTMRRRKSINHSINKLNKNKSALSKSKVFNKTSVPLADDVANISNSITERNADSTATDDHDNDGERGDKIASQIESTLTKISNKDQETGNYLTSKNSADTSSSLSSRDVSLILSKERNKTSKTQMNQKRQSQLENIQICERKDGENNEGSIFKPQADSSSESKGTRLENMQHVKKNLCADLRTSGETDSNTTTSISDPVAENFEDSVSNASTILLPRSRRQNMRRRSSQSTLIVSSNNSAKPIPVVMLHDFLDLKNCCGKLERESNEIWLRKAENEKKNSKTDEKGVEETTARVGKVKSKRSMDDKILARKKLRLEKKAASSKRNRQTLCTRYSGFDTDDSQSSGERVLRLEIQKLEDNFQHRLTTERNSYRGVELNSKTGTEKNVTITFTNTNYNRWKSIFVLSSSEDEDLFTTLNNNSKSQSSRKENGGNCEEKEPSISVKKNQNFDDSGEKKSPVMIQDCYKIVASSSEGEAETERFGEKTRTTEKYSKLKKRKDSADKKSTRTSPGENKDEVTSESSKIQYERLGKQSPGVNRSSGSKSGEESPKANSGRPVARSKVTKEIRSDKRVCKSSDKSEVKIFSSRKKFEDRVFEPATNDKENSPTKISENFNSPVDRASNSQEKCKEEISKRRNSRVKERQGIRSLKERDVSLIEKFRSPLKRPTLRKILRAAESSDSEDDCGDWRIPDIKDVRKNGSKIEDVVKVLGRDWEESSSASSGFIFNDESSGVDDVMTFQPKNYPSDYSRGKKISSRDTNSAKRKTDLKRDSDISSSRKKAGNTTSRIIFRTKEYWESDSDNW